MPERAYTVTDDEKGRLTVEVLDGFGGRSVFEIELQDLGRLDVSGYYVNQAGKESREGLVVRPLSPDRVGVVLL
jgi:hypothetical protein